MDAQLSDASKSRVGKVGIILTNYRPHPPTWLRAVQCVRVSVLRSGETITGGGRYY